jgi:hypothetical protein
MTNHESSSVTYSLECSSCGHEWSETAEVTFDSCPACGAAVEKSSGHFGLVAGAPPSKRRPSGNWGWAEATQSKR